MNADGEKTSEADVREATEKWNDLRWSAGGLRKIKKVLWWEESGMLWCEKWVEHSKVKRILGKWCGAGSVKWSEIGWDEVKWVLIGWGGVRWAKVGWGESKLDDMDWVDKLKLAEVRWSVINWVWDGMMEMELN